MPGKVEKVETEPYDYTVKDTGEVITLTHRFEYIAEEKVSVPKVEMSNLSFKDVMKNTDDENAFSQNGELVH